jgi:outer membrane biosynthesis protein TonB
MQLPLALLTLLTNPSVEALTDLPGVEPLVELVAASFDGVADGAASGQGTEDETKKPKPKPKPAPPPPKPPPKPDPCLGCGMG